MNIIMLFRKLLLFIMPVLMVFIILEIVIESLPNDLKYKNHQLHIRADSIETLILGGSHTFYDLVPEQLNNKTFNLAYVSQSLELDYLILDKYINGLPELKQVVLMVAYLTYSQRWNEAEVNWRKYSYFKYYDITPPYGPKFQKYYPEVVHIPFKQCLIKIEKYLKGETLISCTESGWCYNNFKTPNDKNFDLEAQLAIKRHENGSMDFNPGIKCMEKIIELCRQKNINIVLISFPVRAEYVKYANKDKLQKMSSISKAFSDKYPFVKYYNFTNDPRMTEADFYDVDHLNDEGARKFSRLIYDDVLKL